MTPVNATPSIVVSAMPHSLLLLPLQLLVVHAILKMGALSSAVPMIAASTTWLVVGLDLTDGSTKVAAPTRRGKLPPVFAVMTAGSTSSRVGVARPRDLAWLAAASKALGWIRSLVAMPIWTLNILKATENASVSAKKIVAHIIYLVECAEVKVAATKVVAIRSHV